MKSDYKLIAAGIFVFLSTLVLGSLLTYTFGLISFVTLLVLWQRQWKGKCPRGEDAGEGLIFLVSAIWFALNIAHDLVFAVTGGQVPRRFSIATYSTAFLFPPLLVHMWYLHYRPYLRARRAWESAVAVTYAVCLGIICTYALVFLRWMRFSQWMIMALPFCFMGASVFGVLVSLKGRKRQEVKEDKGRHMSRVALYIFMFVIFVPLLGLIADWIPVSQNVGRYVEVLCKSMPLFFMFVGVYFEERFVFFDIFIKQGIFFLLAMVVLTAYFSLTLPLMKRFEALRLPWSSFTVAPFLFAVTLLPLALAVPWIYRKMEQLLDRAWLGRKFPPEEAVKYFLAGVQTATTGPQLVEHAEKRLSELFRARTRIVLSDEPTGQEEEFPAVLKMLIRLNQQEVGTVLMGRRINDIPYFSEDSTLLASLVDVFSFMLQNVHLQQRKQQQDKREQELMLHASHSELKALRAQINPHFLFNALNAIAVLIHKDPMRAEETVEQLADVFRYTLTRSDKEWVRLEDEMEFVRSYLDIEQARFGNRLRVDLEIDDSVKETKIPSMIVQTLVENAVKHGAAAVRGVGEVRIRATRAQDRIRIEVLDNGPGFKNSETELQPPLAPAATASSRTGSGYGLKNVRQRLIGYFGAAAELKIDRDKLRNLTVVSIEMPTAAGS
ncbi:MAG TPA: histidine kinase [Acidobacteriota bacterium]|jgi:signal transduction histidine kinase